MCRGVYRRVCVCMYVGAYACSHMEFRDGYLFLLLSVLFLETKPLTDTRAILEGSKPQKSSSIYPSPHSDFRTGFSCRCWGFELRPSCSHSEQPYPLSHLPTPKFIFLIVEVAWLVEHMPGLTACSEGGREDWEFITQQ